MADALATTKACGGSGLVTVRADSAYYGRDVVAAAPRGGARFSVTARMNPAVLRAISSIAESAWTPIRYPNAIWDEEQQRLISDAQVAEVEFTAFTSRRTSEQVHGRLIVRRVVRLNPASVPSGQGELFTTYRHHGVFTDTTLPMLDAEKTHRAHAVIEQVHADLKSGPLAHCPSSSFPANSAWLVLAAIAFNLTRAAGATASVFHAKATIRRHPPAPDHHPRQAGTLRPTTGRAPTQRLALASRLGSTVHRRVRATDPSNDLTTQPQQGPTGEHQWKSRTDRPIHHALTKNTDSKAEITPKECRPVDPGSVTAPRCDRGWPCAWFGFRGGRERDQC